MSISIEPKQIEKATGLGLNIILIDSIRADAASKELVDLILTKARPELVRVNPQSYARLATTKLENRTPEFISIVSVLLDHAENIAKVNPDILIENLAKYYIKTLEQAKEFTTAFEAAAKDETQIADANALLHDIINDYEADVESNRAQAAAEQALISQQAVASEQRRLATVAARARDVLTATLTGGGRAGT